MLAAKDWLAGNVRVGDSIGALPVQRVSGVAFGRFRRFSTRSHLPLAGAPPPRFARFASSSGPLPAVAVAEGLSRAFRSRSAFHWPKVARLFIMARWLKARCAAATFSDLPDRFFAARTAARGRRRTRRARQRPHLVHGIEMGVASSSDWPPDRKAMPGTAAGTHSLSSAGLLRDFLDGSALRRLLAGMVMLV